MRIGNKLRKNNMDFKGIKFQNLMYLMSFSLLILFVLWALSIFFLGSLYDSMKLSAIRIVGEGIASAYERGGGGEGGREGEDGHEGAGGRGGEYTDMLAGLDEIAFKQNLRILLIDGAGQILVGYDGFHSQPTAYGGAAMLPQASFQAMLHRLDGSESGKISYINDGDGGRDGIKQAVYAVRVAGEAGEVGDSYLYIGSPIPPVDSMLSILKTQFFLITLILLIVSLGSAQWISRKMAKPIIRLTESAQRLAKGELDVSFSDNGFTEINQLSLALNYATKELRGLDQYRREFIANVSHDLKTPLTIIKFYGEMIRDVSGGNPDKRASHCDTIIKEADWLTGMVNEILELSRLESTNPVIAKTEVDISQCLFATLASFQALVEREGYSFESDIERNLVVAGNEPMLRRVMYNFIGNAVNYTGDDNRVMVSLSTSAGGRKVRFAVADTGDGIPEDKLQAIWDRYYKSGETHRRAVVGAGLGLSIAKSLLALHGADYGVETKVGEGSLFWFELDRSQ